MSRCPQLLHLVAYTVAHSTHAKAALAVPCAWGYSSGYGGLPNNTNTHTHKYTNFILIQIVHDCRRVSLLRRFAASPNNFNHHNPRSYNVLQYIYIFDYALVVIFIFR